MADQKEREGQQRCCGETCPGLGIQDPTVQIALGDGGDNNMILRWLWWNYGEDKGKLGLNIFWFV